jgi:hypothetical protein
MKQCVEKLFDAMEIFGFQSSNVCFLHRFAERNSANAIETRRFIDFFVSSRISVITIESIDVNQNERVSQQEIKKRRTFAM